MDFPSAEQVRGRNKGKEPRESSISPWKGPPSIPRDFWAGSWEKEGDEPRIQRKWDGMEVGWIQWDNTPGSCGFAAPHKPCPPSLSISNSLEKTSTQFLELLTSKACRIPCAWNWHRLSRAFPFSQDLPLLERLFPRILHFPLSPSIKSSGKSRRTPGKGINPQISLGMTENQRLGQLFL